MRGRKKSKISLIVTIVAVALVLLLVVGSLVKCKTVKDKVNDIINPSFSVTFDGLNYKGEDNVIELPESGQAIFNVKNGGGYRVEVKPNVTAETDFNYSVGGKDYAYSGEDLTSVFIENNQIFGDKFVIECNKNFDLQSVLSHLWGGNEVAVTVPKGVYLYKLVVTSSNGETVSFLFGVTVSVVLTPAEIYI